MKQLKRLLREYEDQINLLVLDQSLIQFEYCTKAQYKCWSLLFTLKSAYLTGREQAELDEYDNLLQALEAKYYQILVRNTEQSIKKKEERLNKIQKVEEVLEVKL